MMPYFMEAVLNIMIRAGNTGCTAAVIPATEIMAIAPLYFHLLLKKKINRVSVSAGIFRGVNDYRYTGIELGVKYLFDGPVIVK